MLGWLLALLVAHNNPRSFPGLKWLGPGGRSQARQPGVVCSKYQQWSSGMRGRSYKKSVREIIGLLEPYSGVALLWDNNLSSAWILLRVSISGTHNLDSKPGLFGSYESSPWRNSYVHDGRSAHIIWILNTLIRERSVFYAEALWILAIISLNIINSYRILSVSVLPCCLIRSHPLERYAWWSSEKRRLAPIIDVMYGWTFFDLPIISDSAFRPHLVYSGSSISSGGGEG